MTSKVLLISVHKGVVGWVHFCYWLAWNCLQLTVLTLNVSVMSAVSLC